MADPVQIIARGRGRGVVEITFEQDGAVLGGTALAYPEQGRMIGSPPVDADYAARMNEALKTFNDLVRDLCS